ncbi:MAG TPA: TetR/AcrR family transcriptional regulator [Nocardioides sp.]|uniref:TetR/AcrR family transcriptional regulator n=1 Tax=Nocardioides sp. TaxID=35761 RepID=UPI002B62986A|nr:TetR/AcrR family transcriptional regulator [Nocardioides sp.]HQR26630.1 TetR/AcrR family transcriptional regulator [Nocardioides sp.]
MSAAAAVAPQGRRRVDGEREHEILSAALAVLAEVGYDRLTMDAVAARARASKATLYRRWNGKVELVIDALLTLKQPPESPDTGTLRGDLLAAACSTGGLTEDTLAPMAGVLTALVSDEEFATAFRREVIAPRTDLTRQAFERARERGELRDGVDLDLLAPALAALVLHRLYVLGTPPDETVLTALIDQIILPAALAAPAVAARQPRGTS